MDYFARKACKYSSLAVRDYKKAINSINVDQQHLNMRIVGIVIFFYVFACNATFVYAQNDFAKLEKNVNVRASGLIHHLNASKDTLILKSDSLINKFYTINMKYQRELDMSVNRNSIKIPLNTLSKGRHVVVAVQSPVRIVFVIQILHDYQFLLAMREEKLVIKDKK